MHSTTTHYHLLPTTSARMTAASCQVNRHYSVHLPFRYSKHHSTLALPRTAARPITTSSPPPARACQQHPASKRQTMRTYANFKKYERMRLTVIAKTRRCYHRRSIRYDTGRTQYQRKRHYLCFCFLMENVNCKII